MKRMVMVAIALLLLAGSGFAQPYPGLPDTAYVGLFNDAAHTAHQVNYGGTGFTPFTYYIFWLPNKMGMMAAEFKIQYPANVIQATATKNPAVIIELGTIKDGISISFYGEAECGLNCCRTDWTYSHSVSCFLTNGTQSQIMVVEHPLTLPFPAYQIGSCEPGSPLYPAKRFCHLSLNYDGGVGVESTSWGAIKSLF
jgi:hypothetical protein